jgi:thiol-disulfide isomerase/thioredoxin
MTAHHARRTTCLLAATALLAGCTGGSDGRSVPDQGYVSGDSTITTRAVAEREPPVRFEGTTLDGEPFDVRDHRGKVVVVNVWGSWCPPCIAEAPALQDVWAATGAEGVQFVGINTRDNAAAARAHERRFGVTYPSIDDDGGRVLLSLRGTLPPKAVPSTMVLDRRGRVAARVLGEVGAATLRALVSEALAESPRGVGSA